MPTLSYVEYLANPTYRKFPFDGIIGWMLAKRPPTVEELQAKYEFTYYGSMTKAVNDVNSGTIGANADAEKETAVAGIYTDNGKAYVVLLKDSTEATRMKPAVDMTINLGGNTLTATDKVAFDILSGNVTIDGRLSGSTAQISHTGGTVAQLIQIRSGNFAINGGTYISNAEGTSNDNTIYVIAGNCTIDNATIIATDTNEMARAILIASGATATISNCDISATATAATDGLSIGIMNAGTATISNCAIRAYANYLSGDETSYEAYSRGVVNDGTLTLNNCYAMGTHSGVANHGALYVNGGTYEGYGHGGVYFGGAGTMSYVCDAIIRECDMPDGYTATANDNNAGFYIGGNDEANNIKVYIDNCDIYGSRQPIVLRGSSGEQNNTLYISNSTVNTDAKIRIDNDTHKLYIGTGNNFTADNTNRPAAVIVTDNTYRGEPEAV